MFEIKYNFSGSNSSDAVNADTAAFRYNLFLGSLILKEDNHSIIFDWDWIPLLDFALSLLAICNNLTSKVIGEEEFEFTESDATIIFSRNGDRIKMMSSFSNESLEMNFGEFQKGVKSFYKEIIFDILGKRQELKSNSVFIEYLREAEKM